MIFQWQAQQSLPFVFSTYIRRFSFNPLTRSVLSHVFHRSASWLAPSSRPSFFVRSFVPPRPLARLSPFGLLGCSVLSHVFHRSASWLAPSCSWVPRIPFDSLSVGPEEPAQQVFLGDKRQGSDGMDGWERRCLCRPMGGCGVRLLGPSCLMGMARVK